MATLPRAAPARSTASARAKRAVTSAMGAPTAALIAVMPPTDPIPKTTTYASAIAGEGIAAATASMSAALPASPCTRPTRKGRRMLATR